MTWERHLISLLIEHFPDLPEQVHKNLIAFGREVLKWNKITNLISRQHSESILVRLIVDSLFLLNVLKGHESFLDIGAGAGFPSIPLLLSSQVRGTLAEARRRRAAFLSHILRTFNLSKAHVINRALSPRLPSPVSRLDCLWSKAGIPPQDLFAYGEKWLDSGGRLIVMRPVHSKGEKITLRTLARQHRFTFIGTHTWEIPPLTLTRTLILFERDKVERP